MPDLAASNPQIAFCVPCGYYQYIRKPDEPNCPLCQNPPTHVIEAVPVTASRASAVPSLPLAPAPGDDEPLIFRENCAHCGELLVIELTATSLTVRAPDAPPAGDVSSQQPTPAVEPTDTPPASTVTEGGDVVTTHAASPPSSSPEPAPATS